MRHIVSVSIDAPPERVWRVLEDVERWPDWTESMVSIDRLDQGPLRVGSQARIRQPRMPVAVWTVTELEPLRSFTWENHSPLMVSSGGHAVEPDATGGSVVRLTFEQTGPAAGLVRALLGRRIRRYVELEADGLRRAAESSVSASPARQA
jgi:uncharacterized membrane protein